jgi:hypothetical protein
MTVPKRELWNGFYKIMKSRLNVIGIFKWVLCLKGGRIKKRASGFEVLE